MSSPNPTSRIAPLKVWRKVEKKILKHVLLKPLYRRKSWVKSVGEFWNYTTLKRTSAAAFISERRGLNFQRFSLYAASAAAFITVSFRVAALIFCNFSFMSAAAFKSTVPSATAFRLFFCVPLLLVFFYSRLLFNSLYIHKSFKSI